jgi:pyrimidine-nucleoside phosphorylase
MRAVPRFNPVGVIARKRDGQELSPDEIAGLVSGFVAGEVADYQMSAWLMASLLRGLSDKETVALTDAMLRSGTTLRLRSLRAPKVDKHSTGGVGDKVSLCLAPAVAAAGLAVPMIAGRGLGHTGGTLDKLEAIPGYETRLSEKAFERVVARVGCSIIGQTERIAPADRRLYALRDVTATVESVPLIVASILSKKLAAGLDALVLDVKAGRGAFMPDRESARVLGRALVRVGAGAGLRVTALVTEMDAPIGWAIGNALEVREAVEVLRGEGPPDTVELTVGLGAEMCRAGGLVRSVAEGRARIRKTLSDGSAYERFLRMVQAQGGDPRAVEDPRRLPSAPVRVAVTAARGGRVADIDARALGLLAVDLGAGRTRADQSVDHAVGIEVTAPRGTSVSRGEPLAWLHLRRRSGAEGLVDRARGAFRVSASASAPPRSRILERVTGRSRSGQARPSAESARGG